MWGSATRQGCEKGRRGAVLWGGAMGQGAMGQPHTVPPTCPQEKPKMFAKGTEITHAVVVKKLNEILQARGKKGTDR